LSKKLIKLDDYEKLKREFDILKAIEFPNQDDGEDQPDSESYSL
jgi:hypothetical protein